jgi:hypothetical protein
MHSLFPNPLLATPKAVPETASPFQANRKTFFGNLK